MLSPVLLRSVPLQYQVSYLELLLLGFLVENLLDSLLMILNPFHYLLSDLLDFHQLMNSSDHVVGLFLIVLEEFLYGNGQLRRKDNLFSVYQLERGDAY